MELEFDIAYWLDTDLDQHSNALAVGWALLELSLEDPDYESVAEEIKSLSFTPRYAKRELVSWN